MGDLLGLLRRFRQVAADPDPPVAPPPTSGAIAGDDCPDCFVARGREHQMWCPVVDARPLAQVLAEPIRFARPPARWRAEP